VIVCRDASPHTDGGRHTPVPPVQGITNTGSGGGSPVRALTASVPTGFGNEGAGTASGIGSRLHPSVGSGGAILLLVLATGAVAGCIRGLFV
jgi:hypothetical protein